MSKANRYRHDKIKDELNMERIIITLMIVVPSISFFLGRWSCTW